MSTYLNLNSILTKSHVDHSFSLDKTSSQIHIAQTKIKSYEIELKKIWNYFVKSFELDIFYEEITFNGKSNYSNPSRIKAIQMLNEFFIKNKISYSDDLSLICHDFTLLSEEKIWFMYIVIMGQTLEINEILGIFRNAIKTGIDSVSLFEFFLIFISKYNSNCFQKFLNNNDNIFPEEFSQIYKDNKKMLDQIFGIDHSRSINTTQSSFCDFSFHTRDDDIDIKINNLNYTDNSQYNIDKSIDNKCINIIELEQNTCLIEEILQDEMINDTKLNDRSPSELGKSNGRKFSTNTKFIKGSPALDDYLVPNMNTTQRKINSYLNNSETYDEYSNLNSLVIKINFNSDEDDVEECKVKEDNSINKNILEEVVENEFEDNFYNSYTKFEQDNHDKDTPEDVEIKFEDYYDDDNLLLIDSNFKNRNHFAVFLLMGKLKELYGDKNSLTYMITPIKNSFEERLSEKLEVQKDIDDIRLSNYSNFIYFPFSNILMQLIQNSEMI